MTVHIDVYTPVVCDGVVVPAGSAQLLHAWIESHWIKARTVYALDVEDDRVTFHCYAEDQDGRRLVSEDDLEFVHVVRAAALRSPLPTPPA